jgi:hypothetical protein
MRGIIKKKIEKFSMFLNIKIVKQKVKKREACKFIPSNIFVALRKSINDKIVKRIEYFPRFIL